jgi:hypothetical protein
VEEIWKNVAPFVPQTILKKKIESLILQQGGEMAGGKS